MTITEFLKIKKGISLDGRPASDFMAEYYDEYVEYLATVKDGCGP